MIDLWTFPGATASSEQKTLAECFHRRLVYIAPLGLVPVAVPFGFFGHAAIREMQGFLEAERATNICNTLCIKGFLRSHWSVEMTGIG